MVLAVSVPGMPRFPPRAARPRGGAAARRGALPTDDACGRTPGIRDGRTRNMPGWRNGCRASPAAGVPPLKRSGWAAAGRLCVNGYAIAGAKACRTTSAEHLRGQEVNGYAIAGAKACGGKTGSRRGPSAALRGAVGRPATA